MSVSIDKALEAADWRQGAVEFAEWHRIPWDARTFMGVRGMVAVMSTQEALGFDMSGGGHANWLVVVRGEAAHLVIPGCKVGSITYGNEPDNPDFGDVP